LKQPKSFSHNEYEGNIKRKWITRVR